MVVKVKFEIEQNAVDIFFLSGGSCFNDRDRIATFIANLAHCLRFVEKISAVTFINDNQVFDFFQLS